MINMLGETLQTISSATGLPFWLTIASATVSFRLLMIPIVGRASKRFVRPQATKLAFAQLSQLGTLASAELKKKAALSSEERSQIITLYTQGVVSVFRKNKGALRAVYIAPLINIPAFLFWISSLRGYITNARDGDESFSALKNGGLSYFSDLTAQDATLILPVLAIASTCVGLETAFKKYLVVKPNDNNNNKLSLPQTLGVLSKNTLQLIAMLSFPFVLQLPLGVFFYWIPNSWFSILNNTFKGLPAPPPPSMNMNVAGKKNIRSSE